MKKSLRMPAPADGYGSSASALGDVGNPGVMALAVPEPSTWAMLVAGVAWVGLVGRRRAKGFGLQPRPAI